MKTPIPNKAGKAHWRSVEELRDSHSLDRIAEMESPEGAREFELAQIGASRRGFLGGGLASLGAVAALSGCNVVDMARKPKEKIVPYGNRPEDLVPGRPLHFATAASVGGQVLGMLVESQDGRPTKVEGNPDHPASRGATDVFAQATIAQLYDDDRSRSPRQAGRDAPWKAWDDFAGKHFADLRATGGAGLALLCEQIPSPTWLRLVGEVRTAFPGAKVYSHDLAHDANAAAGAALVGLAGKRAVPDLTRAKVLVALDSDFLGTEGERTRLSMEFADGRRLVDGKTDSNRLYVIEPSFSVTGTMADNRLRLPASKVGAFLGAVAAKVFAGGVQAPAGADAVVAKLAGGDADPRWVDALARDLVAHRGASVVLVGYRQPPEVHALAWLLNAALDAVGATVKVGTRVEIPGAGSLEDLAKAMGAGEVKTLLMVGGNPAWDAPADLGFGALLAKVGTTVHLSYYPDETSARVAWHLPRSHFLEAWGDVTAPDGTAAIQQPLIAPLFDTRSEIEVLSGILSPERTAGYDLVRATWSARPDFADRWDNWVEAGVIERGPAAAVEAATGAAPTAPPATPPAAGPGFDWSGLASSWPGAPGGGGDLEVVFALDPSVLDGRFANLGWLQELPDPLTKLTWDNAALLSPATARRLGVGNSQGISIGSEADVVRIDVDGRSLAIPVFIAPGTADDVVVLPLGYGREQGGRTAAGAGFNAYGLRSTKAPWFATGASLARIKGTYTLASTQDHGRMEPREGWKPRAVVREGTLEEYGKEPAFVEKDEVMEASHIKSLWQDPNETGGLQWGMSVDLSTCTGCGACSVACQAENNIMVVGKDRVMNGRELSWLRLDRYYTGSEDDPEAVVQPLGCAHCGTAPCEGVCPVGATIHSPEGLNDMAYNRCIGTRYCANNCPFKVRRFNFFAFAREADEARPLSILQRNPDVTVRFRGVMEKCTYCVQRINQAKVEAHVRGKDKVQDGAVVTACQQVCPTRSIVFGDLNDPESRVTKLKKEPRNYGVFAELNLQARTTFLAKVRNPNPELA